MTSGYQDMSSASQLKNTERVNIQDFDSDGNNTNNEYRLYYSNQCII